MRIEIICTGDEILTGKTINTNFSHISRKLEEIGLPVRWGTTVGDDRESLLEAFRQAGKRADAVIVNGGLGPTVDDLSQEIAAEAAGVHLVLNEEWLARIETLFRRLGAVMQSNNRKQALLPETAELIDNPIGSACGFAVDIGGARFYFTPGVPRELHLMLDREIVPRLLARSGTVTAVRVKRFHVVGVGESHADSILQGIEDLVPDRSVKLGFQTHYPQLEIKLTLRGPNLDTLLRRLEPLEAEIRRRLGYFIVAEDDGTLEGGVIATLGRQRASLAVAETLTGGLIAARLTQCPGAESVFRRGLVTPGSAALGSLLALSHGQLSVGPPDEKALADSARALAAQAGATHALVVLAEPAGSADSQMSGPRLWVAIATAQRQAVHSSQPRFPSGELLRTGAVEMGLDSLRRFLQGLPLDERA